MEDPPLGHLSRLGEHARDRVEQLGGPEPDRRAFQSAAGVVTADDQDAAVLEQGRRLVGADDRHGVGSGESAGRGVVQLGGGEAAFAWTADATGDQDAAVDEQGGGVVGAPVVQGAGRAEGAGRRVEELGGGQDAVGRPTRPGRLRR